MALIKDYILRGLLADRPAAGILGRLYTVTDTTPGLYFDTGFTWAFVANGGGNPDLATIFTLGGDLVYRTPDSQSTDYCLTGTATDTYHVSTDDASQMIDGNDATKWDVSGGSFPVSATIDLGSIRHITRVHLIMDGAPGADGSIDQFELAYSNDNVIFTDCAESPITPGALDDFLDIAEHYARFWRVTVTGAFNPANAKIRSLGLTELVLGVPTALHLADSGQGLINHEGTPTWADTRPTRATLPGWEGVIVAGSPTLSTTVNANQPLNTLTSTSSGTDGDSLEWTVLLLPGHYYLEISARKASSYGIVDVAVDGNVEVSADLYSASPVDDYRIMADFQVSGPDRHTLTVTVNGKNGSSSGFNLGLSVMWLKP